MSSKKQRNNGYLLPDPIGGYEPICVSFTIPNDPKYVAAFRGAVTTLGKWWNWEKSYEPGDTRAAQAAAYWRELIEQELRIHDCNEPDDEDEDDSPYWEDQDNVDGISQVGEFFEYVADWIVTAFLAVTFSPAAGIIYRTFVPRIRLAFRTGNLGLLADVFIDGILALTLNTSSPTPSISEVDIDLIPFPETSPGAGRIIEIRPRAAAAAALPAFGAFNTEDQPPGRIWREMSRYQAYTGVDVENTPRLEVIRKDIKAPEIPMDELKFRLTETCVLQFSTDNGETWQDVTDWSINALNCFQGPPGEQGEQGEQGEPGQPGEQGPPGENCECPPTNEPPAPPDPEDPDGDDQLCGIAVYIIDYMKALSDDYVAEAQIGSDITDIVASIVALTVAGDIIADNIIALFNQIISLGVTLYDAAIDTSVLEAMKCEMYCELKKQGGWSAAIWEPWKARVRLNDVYDDMTGPVPKAPFIELFMTIHASLADNEWNIRASIGNATPSAFCQLCETCPEECEEVEKSFTFEDAFAEGYTIIAGTQALSSIDGIAVPSGGYPAYPDLPGQPDPTNRNAYVRLNLNAAVNRFQLKFQFHRHNSNPQFGAVAFYIYCYDDQNELMFGGRLGTSQSLQHDVVHTKDIDVLGTEPQCISYAIVVVGCGATVQPGGYVTLLEASTFLDQL